MEEEGITKIPTMEEKALKSYAGQASLSRPLAHTLRAGNVTGK
jgi:hypothetical protein